MARIFEFSKVLRCNGFVYFLESILLSLKKYKTPITDMPIARPKPIGTKVRTVELWKYVMVNTIGMTNAIKNADIRRIIITRVCFFTYFLIFT